MTSKKLGMYWIQNAYDRVLHEKKMLIEDEIMMFTLDFIYGIFPDTCNFSDFYLKKVDNIKTHCLGCQWHTRDQADLFGTGSPLTNLEFYSLQNKDIEYVTTKLQKKLKHCSFDINIQYINKKNNTMKLIKD